MTAAACTDRGRVRPANEDSILADAEAGILIVADGMGGHRAGEVASDMAVSTIHLSLKEALAGPGSAGLDIPGLLSQAIEQANHAIWSRAAADWDLRGMGTTVVMVFSLAEPLWVAHVGDSRAYLARRGEFVRLTQDHSLVAQMVKAGEITPEEARTHPLRNVISRCLGTDKTVQPEIQELAWAPGDYAGPVLRRPDRHAGGRGDRGSPAHCRRRPGGRLPGPVSLANERGGTGQHQRHRGAE